jgi:hypothetical protein
MVLGLMGFASVSALIAFITLLLSLTGAPALAALTTLLLSLVGVLGDGSASGQIDRLPDGFVVTFAFAFLIIGALTRGAITWLTMHPEATMQEAWHATRLRAPALLITAIGYTLCMALGAAGLAVWLRAWHIDSDMLVQPAATPAQMQQAMLAQVADALMPDPIAPHTAVFPRLRSFAYIATVQADQLRRLRSAELKDTVVIGVPLRYAPATLESTLIPLIGLIVIAVSETLWRSRAVIVMRTETNEVVVPCIRMLQFGVMHFGALLVRVWALRLIVGAVCIAGIVLPSMIAANRLVPEMAKVLGTAAAFPLVAFATSAGTALVCALLATFSAIFDVKLVTAVESQ